MKKISYSGIASHLRSSVRPSGSISGSPQLPGPEDLLAERGIMVFWVATRRWLDHFGPMIAGDLRKRSRRVDRGVDSHQGRIIRCLMEIGPAGPKV